MRYRESMVFHPPLPCRMAVCRPELNEVPLAQGTTSAQLRHHVSVVLLLAGTPRHTQLEALGAAREASTMVQQDLLLL